MKNIILFLLIIASSLFLHGQIGINIENPHSTLEIKAINPTGNSTSTDGILIPRIDRERAQNMQNIVTSTVVYINDISTGSLSDTTINVNQPGFYSFDGSVWVKWKLKEGTPTSPISIILNSAIGGPTVGSGGYYRLLVNQQNVTLINGVSITTGRNTPLNRDYFVFSKTGIYEVLIQGNFNCEGFNTASVTLNVYSSLAPYSSFTLIDTGRAGILNPNTTIGTDTNYTFYINITEPNQRIAFDYMLGGSGNYNGRPQINGGRATSFIFKKL